MRGRELQAVMIQSRARINSPVAMIVQTKKGDKVSSTEATVLEIRKRIEAIADEKYRLAFMYQFLIGGEVSEVCGKYAPIGTDAHFVDFEIDREVIPAIVFIIKTARKGGKKRACAIPLDPDFEPWAELVGKCFRQAKDEHPFLFSNTYQSSKRFAQWAAEKAFDGLIWLMREYQTSDTVGKIELRYKPFRSGMLRHIRRKNLIEFYQFDEKDLALYGEWRELIKDPLIKKETYDILDTEIDISDVDDAIRRGENYIKKLLRPLNQLGQDTVPVYLQIRSFYDLSKRFERAQEISVRVRNINNLSKAKLGAEFFHENMQIVLQMLNPCNNEDQFTTKIANLAALSTVNLTPLRTLVSDPGDKRSIRLIEAWLTQNGIAYNKAMIETWANISSLRNMEPIHQTDPVELKRILDFFAIPMKYPLNYSDLWDVILDRFRWSLDECRNILNEI